MKNIFVFLAVMLFMLSFVACEKKEAELIIPTIGNVAPDFMLRDINGNTINLGVNRGKVILIEFWATWCPPCKELLPVLEELYKRYSEKGFIIISLVSADEGDEIVKSFVKEYGITYPVLFADADTLKQYGISSIPISFIINKEGRIVNKHLGYTPDIRQELTVEIEKLL